MRSARSSRLPVLGFLTLLSIAATPLSASAQWDWQLLDSIPLAGLDSVSSSPYGITLHPDPLTHLAYVALAGQVAPFGGDPALYSGHTVIEFRTDTFEVVRSFPVGYYPTEVAVTADGAELYVTTSTESTLFKIQLATAQVTALPITDSLGSPVGFLSGVEISHDGTRVILSSNGGSFDGSSENVLVVDRASGLVVDRWVVAGGMGRFSVRSDGRVVLPVGFPDDDFTAAPQIRIYDTQGPSTVLVNTLTLAVDTSDFPAPSDITLSADGSRAYITIFGGSAEVVVVDVDNATLLPPLSLGGADFVQTAISLTPDGASLVVADFFGGKIRIIDRLTAAFESELIGLSLPNAFVQAEGRLFVTEQGFEQIAIVGLPGAFLRGDPNRDGVVNLADGIATLNYLFTGGTLSCAEAADFDGGGAIDLGDAISIFSYLFQSGVEPSAPFPIAGELITGASSLACSP